MTAVVLLAAGCAQAAGLQTTDRTPSTTGKVEVKADKNKNTDLEVHAEHLPPPQNLDPSPNTFVVWIRPPATAEFQNVGQIKMSGRQEGKLRTKTPYSEFDVLVTAEPGPTPPRPSDWVVLRGHAKRGQ